MIIISPVPLSSLALLHALIAQELVANNSGVPVISYMPSSSPRERLAYELALFEEEYFAMLYGGPVSKAAGFTCHGRPRHQKSNHAA